MRKYAVAVAKCRRYLKKYAARIDGLIGGIALTVGGDTYALVAALLALVEKKRQLALVAALDRLMSAELTVAENDALTICTCGEGSRRAAARLGVGREEILRLARRALDKCCAALKGAHCVGGDDAVKLYADMEKIFNSHDCGQIRRKSG